jgi:hypothetical protein
MLETRMYSLGPCSIQTPSIPQHHCVLFVYLSLLLTVISLCFVLFDLLNCQPSSLIYIYTYIHRNIHTFRGRICVHPTCVQTSVSITLQCAGPKTKKKNGNNSKQIARSYKRLAGFCRRHHHFVFTHTHTHSSMW